MDDREYQFDQLDPDRLLECAKAAYDAAKDVQEYTGGEMMYPADLMGHELQPDMLSEYTKFEIEQASEFLVRMGWIDAPKRTPRQAA